jgi:aconitase A
LVICFEVDHTLVDPKVKVSLPITHAVVGDFYVRDAALLAAPLGKGFDRNAENLRNLDWTEQLLSSNRTFRSA